MKTYISVILILLACFTKLSAQQNQSPLTDDDERQQKWKTEMRNYKHEFMAKELDLDKEQQRKFFAEYDKMEDRILIVNNEARDLEQRVLSDTDISDAELESAAKTLYDTKKVESDIESEYYDKFKSILTPKQLIRLKNTERKFTQQLVRQHRRLKASDGSRRKQ